MPIFKNAQWLPSWCEMTFFEIANLKKGETRRFERAAAKEKLFVCEGLGSVLVGETEREAGPGQIYDLGSDGMFVVSNVDEPLTLVRVAGHWGEEIGSCGVFTLDKSDSPRNDGDPTAYPRNTVFDNHYHDFDEYWIIVNGRGRVVTEGQIFDVAAGDCVATAMRYHHDFPFVFEKITGVYFETTLRGQKRLGHLWEHTHGPAIPNRNATW